MRPQFEFSLKKNPAIFTRPQELQDLFTLTFPNTSGTLPEQPNESLIIPLATAQEHRQNFMKLHQDYWTWGWETYCEKREGAPKMCSWIETRPTGKGQIKTSKLIMKWAEHLGINTESKEFQATLRKWVENFIKPGCKWEIRTDPESFSEIGEYAGVDTGCCFKKGLSNQHHPLILASCIDNCYPTFMVLLKDLETDKVVARCWGFIFDPDGSCMVSNFYTAKATCFSLDTVCNILKTQARTPNDLLIAEPTSSSLGVAGEVYFNADRRYVTTRAAQQRGFTKTANRSRFLCISCKKDITNTDESSRFLCYNCKNLRDT